MHRDFLNCRKRMQKPPEILAQLPLVAAVVAVAAADRRRLVLPLADKTAETLPTAARLLRMDLV